MMSALTLQDWLEGLAAQLHESAGSALARYLARHRVTRASLAPWLHFAPDHYTRSLLYQSPRWQCVLMCWDLNQRTTVHDHNGKPAWISLMEGQLHVRNFVVRRLDSSHSHRELEEVEGAVLDCDQLDCPTEAEAGIHEVSASSARRAVSIHVYGRPMSHCGVYDRESGAYWRRPLWFDRDLRAHFSRNARSVARAAGHAPLRSA